ncbi:MAG: S-layer homology domain-containing protein [Oscillospiraceae bacterium]|nr:S-layer homology domain-containing protein [Oscillospiraceae bacterium]
MSRNTYRFLSVLLIAVMLCTLLPATVFAEDAHYADSVALSGAGTASEGRLTLEENEIFRAYYGGTDIQVAMTTDGVLSVYPGKETTVLPGIKGWAAGQLDATLDKLPWCVNYWLNTDNAYNGTAAFCEGFDPGKLTTVTSGTYAGNHKGTLNYTVRRIVIADGMTAMGGYMLNQGFRTSAECTMLLPDSLTRLDAVAGSSTTNLPVVPERIDVIPTFLTGRGTCDIYVMNRDAKLVSELAHGRPYRGPLYATMSYDEKDQLILDSDYYLMQALTVHVLAGGQAEQSANELKNNQLCGRVAIHDAINCFGPEGYRSALIWMYDESTQTLTVAGSAAMPDYASYEDTPWHDLEICNVEVRDFVAAIGENAFSGLKDLDSLLVNDSVKEIAETAFYLEDGMLPTSFAKTEITCGAGSAMEEYIAAHAATRGVFGDFAWEINGTRLTVTGSGRLELGGATVPWYFFRNKITAVDLGFGVTAVSGSTFAGMQRLSRVNLPSTLRSIGAGAFANDPALTDIYIPKAVTEIEEDAFAAASIKELTLRFSVTDDSVPSVPAQKNRTVTVDRETTLQVLFLGNSYCHTLRAYLSEITKQSGIVNYEIDQYYYSAEAGNVAAYAEMIRSDAATLVPENNNYNGYFFSTGGRCADAGKGGRTTAFCGLPLSVRLQAEDWDYVITEAWGATEPAGGNGTTPGKLSTDPNLQLLTQYVLDNTNAQTAFFHVYSCGWMLRQPACAGDTLTSLYEKYVAAYDDGMENLIDLRYASGTLIETARKTWLNDGRDFHRSETDITHLSETGDYMNAILLFEQMTGREYEIDSDKFDERTESFMKLLSSTTQANPGAITYATVTSDEDVSYYKTLEEAVAAAHSGDTLTVIGLPVSEEKLPVAEGVTVELYGSIRNNTVQIVNGSAYFDENGLSANGLVYDPVTGLTAAKTMKVRFDAAGGNVSAESKTVTYGAPYGQLPTPIRDLYTFDGWFTDAEGDTEITSSTVVTMEDDHTLYAHWTHICSEGHDYAYFLTKTPTETEDGALTGVCARCGSTVTVVLPKLNPADYVCTVTKEPTCTEDGSATYVWKNEDYGDISMEAAIPALGHVHVYSEHTDASCTEPGYDRRICDDCGAILSEAAIPALGHAWDNGKITTPATETEDGMKTFTCTRCGATKTEVIPATGDDQPCDGGENCPSKDFKDVNYGDWYHEAVDFAVSRGLFNGMTKTSFEPNTAMTRGMLVTVLWRYEKMPYEGENVFDDVKDSDWYADAVAWAAANGIVTGVGNNKFDPNGMITREQMAAILFRYSDGKGYDTEQRGDLSGFPDRAKVSGYATDAIEWAVAEKLITGSGGYLDPQGSATRAQVATILMRFIRNIAE